MHQRMIRLAIAAFLFALSFGATANWEPAELEKNVSVLIPEHGEVFPLMIITQGTGEIGRRERTWAQWFTSQGVAVALINSAGLRGRKDLSGLDSFFDYSSDAQEVVNWLGTNPKIDTSRIGIIGFSRGGTMALMSGQRFCDPQKIPSFVFAFYPGAQGNCPNTYGSATAVHIFYGDVDEWGQHQGLQKACRTMAENAKNAIYHELQGAHHGFDQPGSSTFRAERTNFKKEFNGDALDESRSIILKALRGKWSFSAPSQP